MMGRTLLVGLLATTALLPVAVQAKPKTTADLAPVAAHAAQVVKAKLPPAATVVVVTPMRGKGDDFGPLLEGALRATGFAVGNDKAARGAQPIGYDVARSGGEVLLKLSVAGEQTARLLRPTDNGTMALAGPVAVKETD